MPTPNFAPLVVGLWGLVLLVSSLTGRLDLLLRGAFHPLVGLSGAALIALAVQQLWGVGRSQRLRLTWVLSGGVALLVLLIPPNPSFSDLASNRPAELVEEPALSFSLPPAQRSLTDWVRLLRSQPDPSLYAGDPVRISGFVLVQAGDRPQLGRLLVRCCLADATPVGLPVRWPVGYHPKTDSWLAIRGSMGVEQHNGGSRSVVLARQILPIPRPARPLEP